MSSTYLHSLFFQHDVDAEPVRESWWGEVDRREFSFVDVDVDADADADVDSRVDVDVDPRVNEKAERVIAIPGETL